ncbi:MAG: Spy/CpxP family protein refolding chaperone [Gammaproteobacteria bacterium]
MNTKDENRNETPSEAPKKPGRRRWLGYSLAGLAGILGVTSISAVAMGGPDGWCRGGYERMHWGGKHRGEGFEPDRMREFAERKIDHVLYEIDATQQQRQQVKEILGKALDDLGDRRAQRQQDRKAFIDILTQQEIDRTKLEALRSEKLLQMETTSKRLMEAFADAAEVLTPEQRSKLGELIAERGFGPGRHRW